MSSLKIFKLPDKTLNKGNKVEILPTLIPPAIIGRGALLKCAEKKVSRTQATIDWDDDGIIITSTHSTPTYTNINGQLKTLNKGESSVLKNGDKFGLLADSFWYEISLNNDHNISGEKMDSETLHKSSNGDEILENISIGCSVECDEKNQTRESSTLQDATISFDSSEQKVFTKEDVSADVKMEQVACHVVNIEAPLLSENKNPDASAQNSKAIYTEKSEVTAVDSSRQRSLPTWLLSGKTNYESKLAPNKALKKTKRGGNVNNNKVGSSAQKERNIRNDAQQIAKNSVKRVKTDSRNVSKKKQYHSVSQEYDDHPDLNEKNLNPLVNDEDGDYKQDSDYYDPSKNDVCAEVAASCSAYAKETPLKCDENLHGVSDDDSASGQSSPVKKNAPNSSPLKGLVQSNDIERDEDTKKQRKSCLFASNCYRRNPAHKKEFLHPGDEDYSPPNDDASDDDERPQCEHGIDCYRKNPKHRKEYKHTRIPQPRRRAARAKRKRSDDDDNDSENEYDADDPFLNDDSSDDYAPTDEDSDSHLDDDAVEEDDTKRMLKESNKFTKKHRG